MAWKRITALAAVAALGVASCGSPSGSSGNNNGNEIKNEAQAQVADAAAKGPAKAVDGAKKGGTMTILSDVTPGTMDPTNTYYVDGSAIQKLFFRALTQYDIRNGAPVLVPDLAEDLGKASEDGLTWTFKLKKGIKYHDGTPVKAEDYAYAIKRSFAHEIFADGPAYQLAYFKDHDKYKGPYAPGGDAYAGVETPDDHTLVIKLDKPWKDLPYYVSFPLFTPIPKAKDTRQNYEKSPMSTGPYMVQSYSPGTELKLTKNPNWDANSDPVRQQYVDNWVFKFGLDPVKVQRQVIASSGPDANALNYSNLDSTLLPLITEQNKAQLVKGPGTCEVFWTMDSRKVPLEVRRAIAAAYPYDSLRKIAGLTDFADPPASTILPAAVPGYEKFEIPGLNGKGDGDPAKAKEMLKAAGKEGFELSWYYSNDDNIATQVSQARAQALEKAGFKTKPIGVPKANIRKLTGDQNGPVNMGKAPAGWCSDWPSPTSWFSVLFKSQAIAEGNSVGQLESKELDAEIDRVEAMDPEEALKNKEWSKLDRKILEEYLPALPIRTSNVAFPVGKNIGNPEVDTAFGMPHFVRMYLKQP